MIFGVIAIWLMIGMVVLRLREEGWLIMITDPLNVGSATWLALPSLVICWLLWPFNISRYLFLFALMIGR